MIKLKYLTLFMLAAFALAACAPQATPQATPEATLESAEFAPDETATPTMSAPPRPASVADNCLECHTDKDKLIALAVEDEQAGESESEGVG